MPLTRFLCAGVLTILASHATGTGTDYDKLYNDCLPPNVPLNNSLVASCAMQASDAAKKDMNRLYQQLYLSLQEGSPEDAQQLEDAQKSWLLYRNAHCDLQGKRIGSPMYYTCPMQLNGDRVAELQFLLDQGG